MIRWLSLCILPLAQMAAAETIVAARTIPAQSILQAEDLTVSDRDFAGGVTNAALLIGKEAKVALFPGRPIRVGDVGTPAIVERNQIIELIYETNGLTITTDGRSLGRAGPGDVVRVMNLASRTTVIALITEEGLGHVQR